MMIPSWWAPALAASLPFFVLSPAALYFPRYTPAPAASGPDAIQADAEQNKSTLLAAAPDAIYHVHIPKVAGISFMNDAMQILKSRGLRIISEEGCATAYDADPRVLGTAILFRHPKALALSEYSFCTEALFRPYFDAVRPPGSPATPESFEQWVSAWAQLKRQGWHGDFTPAPEPVSSSPVEVGVRALRMIDWAAPPWSYAPRNLDMKDWPRLDGGGTIWHCAKMPFACYSPIDPQSQRLACQAPLRYDTPVDVDLAISNMRKAFFVGVIAAYQESICLLHVKLGGALPRYCDCADPAKWSTFRGTETNIHGNHTHGTMKKRYSAEVNAMVDELTSGDLRLYAAVKERFLAEVREAEGRFGVKILCDVAKLDH